ncbi:hypothetical protein [Paenibacillus chungangensis]|uniref:Spore coat protein n=1 Tax=Paenibacillus chungangensis TaxID=696535 RepID=A0ABW3HWD0_9BACL
MLRGVAWLGKIVAAGLLISFLSIWTTGYIVTSYVETALKQYNIPLDMPPMAMSGVWGDLWGSEPLLTAQAVDESEKGTEERTDDAASAFDEQLDEWAKAPLTDIGGGSGSHAEEGLEEVHQGSVAESGELDDSGHSDLEGIEAALTTEELDRVKNTMSEEDKVRLLDILSTKLPQETWQKISKYVEEGLSEEELLSIQQLMAQHLDQEEYDEMMGILKKY